MNLLLYAVGMEKLAKASCFKFIRATRDIHTDEVCRKFSYGNEFQPIRGADDVFHTNKKGTENQRPYSPVKLWFSIKLIATEFFSTPFNCWMASITTY